MIDVSFYFNYLISGLSAGSYYFFNITVHIVNTLLLFRFSSRLWLVDEKYQYLTALLTAFFFMVYPFHNESVAWLSGRLSSMACLFALLALIISNEKKGTGFLLLSIACYLAGMLCYEAIFFLPIIIILLNWRSYKSKRLLYFEGICWAAATCIYPLLRLLIAGEITGSYGSRVADQQLLQKLLNAAKVTGRLFLPPSGNQVLLTATAILLMLLLAVVHRRLLRGNVYAGLSRHRYLQLLTALFISLIIPVAFGVSTRTSEGDRLLYFPSVFLCILVASWLTALCNNTQRRVWVVVLGLYCICMLELNNRNWVKASVAASDIMGSLQDEKHRMVIFINMPEEWEGAFIFRNGFRNALAVNHINENVVKVVNYLKRDGYLKAGDRIAPVSEGAVVRVFPSTQIIIKDEGLLTVSSSVSEETITAERGKALVYFWNKERMLRLF